MPQRTLLFRNKLWVKKQLELNVNCRLCTVPLKDYQRGLCQMRLGAASVKLSL